MKKELLLALSCSAWLAALPSTGLAQTAPLPALDADLSQTSVSGISSGGFMAAQLATAYSATFTGVGVIAAGPYYCAGTYEALPLLQNALTTCMSPLAPSVGADARVSWKNALRFAAAGKIDPVANLARQRVYIFSGGGDRTVKTMVVDQVEQYYRLAGTPAQSIRYHKDASAGHSIITKAAGDVACPMTLAPFINNCGFVQSHELLRHIYPQKKSAPITAAAQGEIIQFNQSEFVKGTRSSMDQDAYVYVPKYCKSNRCIVHVALHGCLQGAGRIGARFYTGTGYNEYADQNKMIVLYPQAAVSTGVPPNPQGCWDFWGYSSEDQNAPSFFTQGAPQMSAIVAMVRRLGQARSAQP